MRAGICRLASVNSAALIVLKARVVLKARGQACSRARNCAHGFRELRPLRLTGLIGVTLDQIGQAPEPFRCGPI